MSPYAKTFRAPGNRGHHARERALRARRSDAPGDRQKARERRLRDELDLTVVLVEHDLALVWKLADEITVLDAGRVVESGSPDKVVGNPTVQKLFWGERDA